MHMSVKFQINSKKGHVEKSKTCGKNIIITRSILLLLSTKDNIMSHSQISNSLDMGILEIRGILTFDVEEGCCLSCFGPARNNSIVFRGELPGNVHLRRVRPRVLV